MSEEDPNVQMFKNKLLDKFKEEGLLDDLRVIILKSF